MTTPSLQIQKRKRKRYPVSISCEVALSGGTHHAETKNLSVGGVAIIFEHALAVGEVITVSFFLTEDGIEESDGRPFECAASIRWSQAVQGRRHRTGLEFLSLSVEQVTHLESYLKRIG